MSNLKNNGITDTFEFQKRCVGVLSIKVYKDDKIVQNFRSKNLIVNKMRDAIAGLLTDDPDFNIHTLKLGTCDVAPEIGQGDLSQPKVEKMIAGIELVESCNAILVRATFSDEDAVPTDNYKEAGLFLANGKMISRIIINPYIEYTEGVKFVIEWSITFS